MIVHVIVCALAIVGLHIFLNNGPLAFVGKFLQPEGVDEPRFALADPLGSCVFCMASLYAPVYLHVARELPLVYSPLLVASVLFVVCWVLLELLLEGTPAGKVAKIVSVAAYLATVGTVLLVFVGSEAIVFVLAVSGTSAVFSSVIQAQE